MLYEIFNQALSMFSFGPLEKHASLRCYYSIDVNNVDFFRNTESRGLIYRRKNNTKKHSQSFGILLKNVLYMQERSVTKHRFRNTVFIVENVYHN